MLRFYDEMNKRLAGLLILDSINEFINEQDDEEIKEYLSFLYLNMPYADIVNVDKTIFLDYALVGKELRASYCKTMEEDIFLNYVLFHRINDEKIVANRSFFYEKVKDILGSDEKENVLRLNYWCATNLSYRSTDDRSLDPLSLYKSGFGRCGEESIFAISVFRSAGIAARQVYSPRWAHCDDNHAWVEVFVEGCWQYLGACEPEEILNKGWFDDAAARAMLVRSRIFNHKRLDADNLISQNGVLCELNETSRYADVKKITIKLRQGSEILRYFDFNICLMNYASFSPIAKVKTNEEGEYYIEIGKGMAFISLYKDKNYIIPIDIQKKEIFDIDIKEYESEIFKYNEIYVSVPKASTRNRKKAPKRKKYEYKNKEFPNKDVENIALSMGMKDLWDILLEKDKRDIKLYVLKEAYKSPNKYEVNESIYLNYIQNPRVNYEVLSLCRDIFRKKFLDINNILEFIKDIRLSSEIFITEPIAVYKNKLASALSIKIFVVTALRSLGIAAKLENNQIYICKEQTFEYLETDEIIDKLEYIDSYNIVKNKAKKKAYLHLGADTKTYMQDFSISFYNQHTKQLEIFDSSSIKEDMQVRSGEYVLSTSNRLPNGNICCKYMLMNLEENKKYKLKIELMNASIKDMLSDFSLPESIIDRIKPNEDFSLLMFLKEEEEPSQHIANDILKKQDLLDNIQLNLIFEQDFEEKDFAIKELLTKAKKYEIYTNFNEEIQENLGRSLFVNYETLPIVALCKNKKVVYAFSGYQVGSGDIIEKIIKSGVKNE